MEKYRRLRGSLVQLLRQRELIHMSSCLAQKLCLVDTDLYGQEGLLHTTTGVGDQTWSLVSRPLLQGASS